VPVVVQTVGDHPPLVIGKRRLPAELLAIDLVAQPLGLFEHVRASAKVDVDRVRSHGGIQELPGQIEAYALLRGIRQMTKQLRCSDGLLAFDADQGGIVDGECRHGCPCRYGRHRRPPVQEPNLADRGAGLGNNDPGPAARFQVDVDAARGHQIHVVVVLALPAQDLAGCELHLSADRSQRCQVDRRNPRGFNQILHAWFAMRAKPGAEVGA
jgi:hypothetical protein